MANTGNIDNIKQGAAILFVDDGSGERDVGFTGGDFKLNTEPQVKEILTHQGGEVPVDYRGRGMKASLSVGMMEPTLENMAAILPLSVTYTDGTKKSIGVGLGLNQSYGDKAVKLRIHPINSRGTGGIDDPTWLDEDVSVWRAVNMNAVEEDMSGEDVKMYAVEFTILPDFSKPAGHQLYLKGDPTVADVDVTPPDVETVQAEVSDVLTTVPQGGGSELTGVDTDTVVEITMTEETPAHMSTSKFFQLIADADGASIPCDVTSEVVSGTPNKTKVTLTPSSALSSLTSYWVAVSGVRDVTGNIQSAAWLGKFATA